MELLCCFKLKLNFSKDLIQIDGQCLRSVVSFWVLTRRFLFPLKSVLYRINPNAKRWWARIALLSEVVVSKRNG